MRISKLAKNMLKYLPVLAVLFATVVGLTIGKNLYPASVDSQSNPSTQWLAEPNEPQPLMILGGAGACGFSNIYTSLPPKCKTSDGKFIPVPGTSPFILVTPEGK